MLNPGKLVTLGQLRDALLRADKALDALDDEVGRGRLLGRVQGSRAVWHWLQAGWFASALAESLS
jgi:hypothetical protein